MTQDKDFTPETDGITHINVYSKGKTQLGRALSNFAHTPFNHAIYGEFASMEGFWYWISTGSKNDSLRRLYGFKAKSEGKQYPRVTIPRHVFEGEIIEAAFYKLKDNPDIADMLMESTLPLTHYYAYGSPGTGYKVIHPESGVFLIEYFERLRAFRLDGM